MTSKDKIIEEIRQYRLREKTDIQEDEITKEDLMSALGVSDETVRLVMKDLVAQGEFERRFARNTNGNRVVAWKRIRKRQDRQDRQDD